MIIIKLIYSCILDYRNKKINFGNKDFVKEEAQKLLPQASKNITYLAVNAVTTGVTSYRKKQLLDRFYCRCIFSQNLSYLNLVTTVGVMLSPFVPSYQHCTGSSTE